MPLYYSNFKSFSNKISRIFWLEQLFCTAFISYTERPILALSSAWEAGGLIWVDFNLIMSQQAPMRWALNSWAAQANHGYPNGQLTDWSFLSYSQNSVNSLTQITRILALFDPKSSFLELQDRTESFANQTSISWVPEEHKEVRWNNDKWFNSF